MYDLFKQNKSSPSSSNVDESSASNENNSLLQKSQPNVEFYGSTAKSTPQQQQRNLSSRVSVTSTDSIAGPYPAAVIFVLLSKLFEAFAANGVRSILALYFRDSLRFDEGYSTSLLHTFNFFSQFLPIIGAILADSYLGNAKTIFIFYIPYAIGYVGMFLGTLPFATHVLIYSSLFLVAIGNGCLRACITALGGHQFKLPEQKRLLDKYFSLYYFCYYFGILLGKIVPAYFRTEVTVLDYCRAGDECYPAVFGLILMVFMVSWLIFVFGYSYYKREHVTGGNTMLRTMGCIGYALVQRVRGRSKGMPWLNGSIGRYSESFVADVAIFLRVITLFLPIPVYYALLAQQDSSWTYQATQTNTTILGNVRLQADQFKAIGPVLLLLLIPAWQKIALPILEKFGVHITCLESVSIGGLCAGFSFVWAGFFQHKIHEFKDEKLSVMWQFPMFLLIMMAEVLISVPGLQFCYTHAPASMKSVLTAVWFINNAMGNLIVVFISQLRLTANRSIEFFLYAFLMFVATIVFTMLSGSYEDDRQRRFSDEQVIENYIYVDEVQSTNLEENFIDDDSESFQSMESDNEKLAVY